MNSILSIMTHAVLAYWKIQRGFLTIPQDAPDAATNLSVKRQKQHERDTQNNNIPVVWKLQIWEMKRSQYTLFNLIHLL